MILYATDFDRTKRIVIDTYSHVNWEPSFDDEGTFEMVVPKEVAKKISHDMVIENSEDPFNQAYVQYNDFDTNEGIDSYVTIKGYFLNIKLRERVCLGAFEFEDDTLENVMSMLLETSVATPRDFGRNLNIIYSSEDLKGLTLSFENSYNDLFDNIKKVCQQLDLGFKLMLEQDCSFSLHIYDGLDLSNEVKLSMELDTSTAMMYFKDSSGEANVVYVMGDDETIVEEVDLGFEVDYGEEGHVELEYIESTGTQFIDTGFVPNNNTRVVIDFEIISQPINVYYTIFSSRSNSYSDAYCVFSQNITDAPNTILDCYGTNRDIALQYSLIGRHVIDKNKNNVILDNTIIYQHDYNEFNAVCELRLLADNKPDGGDGHYFVGKLYSCQIYDNDVLIRDCIPVKYKNGTICLFDKVRRKYLLNKGTGEFIAGQIKVSKAKRKETFLSVSDVKRGDLSESAYRAILRSKVLEMKESFKATISVESSLTPQNRIQYGEHFLIGDIITQEFKDFGVESASRVTGVSQMWSIDGYTVAIISSNVKKRRR